MKKSTYFLFFASTLALLHTCGKIPSDEKNKLGDVLIGNSLPIAADFEKPDYEILARLCTTLRTKKFTYATEFTGDHFKFLMESSNCSDEQESREYDSVLSMKDVSGDLYFSGIIDSNYFRNVQTHQEGPLAPYCDQLFKGVSISTEVEISETEKHQLQVEEGNGEDFYKLMIGKKDKEGKFIVIEEQHFQINTDPALNASSTLRKKLGLEAKSTRYLACENSKLKHYTLVQSYIED